MAKKATLSSVQNIPNNATSINSNLSAINEKLDNTLSLDGSTPNAMGADLDLSNNDLINVGALNADSILLGGKLLTSGNSTLDISALTAILGSEIVNTDLLAVESNGTTKKLSFSELKAYLELVYTALAGSYEVGEFTPVVADDQTAGNTGTGTFKGYYTRIGRAVFVQVTLQQIDTTGMTGGNDLYIRGLPFTSEHLAGSNHFVSAVNGRDITFNGILTLDMLDQTDYLRIQETISGSVQDFVTVSEISSGVTNVFATFYYFTTD
jgi:hypothetical protein